VGERDGMAKLFTNPCLESDGESDELIVQIVE